MPDEGAFQGAVTGLSWRKSAYSNPSGNCVEVAAMGTGEVAVRNSRYTDGPVLVYSKAALAAFIGSAKDGEFDDLIA